MQNAQVSALMKTVAPVVNKYHPIETQSTHTLSITIEPSQEDITIRSIFNYLNESGKEVYIAIDDSQESGSLLECFWPKTVYLQQF